MTLSDRIDFLCGKHGSLRAVARVLGMDAGYLSRLASGEKTSPSNTTLRKLDLRAITSYEIARTEKPHD